MINKKDLFSVVKIKNDRVREQEKEREKEKEEEKEERNWKGKRQG